MKKSIYCFDYCDEDCLDKRVNKWNKKIDQMWKSDLGVPIVNTAVDIFNSLYNKWLAPPKSLHPVEYGDMLISRCEELKSLRDGDGIFPNWWPNDWDIHLKTSYPYHKDFINKINYTIFFYSDLLGMYGNAVNNIKKTLYPIPIEEDGKLIGKDVGIKPFTMQQVFVFNCMLAQMSDKEIASKMNIARRTISEHRLALLKKINKLGIDSIILFDEPPINNPMYVRSGFEHHDFNPSLSRYQYERWRKDKDFWEKRNDNFYKDMINIHSDVNKD